MSYPKLVPSRMVLKWLSSWLRVPPDTRKKVDAAKRNAATFHDQAGHLVDVDEISEENQNKLEELFRLNESEGRKHRMVRAVEGKKTFSCIKCVG